MKRLVQLKIFSYFSYKSSKKKRELHSKLKHQIRDYPKNAEEFIPQIERHETTYEPIGATFW